MEAVTVALAVLPLLVSAVEHYDALSHPIERFRRFEPRAERFLNILRVQKAIFRNQCRILLCQALEADIAESMVKDCSHPAWQSQEVERELLRSLGDAQSAIETVLNEIEGELKLLSERSQGLESILTNSQSPFRTRVKKLRLSFSKRINDTALTNLRALNDDLLKLSSQLLQSSPSVRDASWSQKRRAYGILKMRENRDPVARFKQIRAASAAAYEAVAGSCPKHKSHTAVLWSKVATLTDRQAPGLRLTLGITELLLPDRPRLQDIPISFLAIDSVKACGGQYTSVPLKRTHDGPMEQGGHHPKRDFNARSDGSCFTRVSNPASIEEGLTNVLHTRVNLCEVFVKPNGTEHRGLYLGCAPSGYHQYASATDMRQLGSEKRVLPTTLEQVLADLCRMSPTKRLPHVEVLRLARMLATSVLQFHSTPWLRDSWRSRDVCLLSGPRFSEESSVLDAVSLPFLRARIQNNDASVSTETALPSSQVESNALLYGLGTMFLEIAHSAPLQLLTKSGRLDHGIDRCTEYVAVRNMARLISRGMGPRYQRVVEKCVGCHFAAGYDLNEPDLQLEFYHDVVRELEDLENEMRSLEL